MCAVKDKMYFLTFCIIWRSINKPVLLPFKSNSSDLTIDLTYSSSLYYIEQFRILKSTHGVTSTRPHFTIFLCSMCIQIKYFFYSLGVPKTWNWIKKHPFLKMYFFFTNWTSLVRFQHKHAFEVDCLKHFG